MKFIELTRKERLGLKLMQLGARWFFNFDDKKRDQAKADRLIDSINGSLLLDHTAGAGGHGYIEGGPDANSGSRLEHPDWQSASIIYVFRNAQEAWSNQGTVWTQEAREERLKFMQKRRDMQAARRLK